jgi:type I restriction enzyme S subunit
VTYPSISRVSLGDILEEVDVRAGSTLSDLPVLSLTKDRGLIPQSDRFKQRVARDDVSEYKVIRKGQIAHNPYVLWEGAVHSLKDVDAGLVSPVYPVWRAREEVDVSYVDFLLRTPAMLRRYEQLASGAVKRRRSISKGTFSSIEVSLPSLSDQRRVVTILHSIQEVRRQQKVVLRSLSSMRTSLAGQLLFDAGWQLGALGDHSTISSGGTPSRSKPEYWGGTIPWVKTAEVRYETIKSTGETITEAGLEGSSAKVYPAGTVLMAMYGEGATRGRIARLGIDAAVNQACAAIIPDSDLEPGFLYQCLAHSYDAVRTLSHGSHQKNLSASLLKRFSIPLPDLDAQRSIARQLLVIDARVSAEELELDKLNQLLESALANYYESVEGPTQ